MDMAVVSNLTPLPIQTVAHCSSLHPSLSLTVSHSHSTSLYLTISHCSSLHLSLYPTAPHCISLSPTPPPCTVDEGESRHRCRPRPDPYTAPVCPSQLKLTPVNAKYAPLGTTAGISARRIYFLRRVSPSRIQQTGLSQMFNALLGPYLARPKELVATVHSIAPSPVILCDCALQRVVPPAVISRVQRGDGQPATGSPAPQCLRWGGSAPLITGKGGCGYPIRSWKIYLRWEDNISLQ